MCFGPTDRAFMYRTLGGKAAGNGPLFAGLIDQLLDPRDWRIVDRPYRLAAARTVDCSGETKRPVGNVQLLPAKGALCLCSDPVEFIPHMRVYITGICLSERTAWVADDRSFWESSRGLTEPAAGAAGPGSGAVR